MESMPARAGPVVDPARPRRRTAGLGGVAPAGWNADPGRGPLGEADGDATPYVTGAEALPWNGGVTAADLSDAVRPLVAEPRVEHLSHDPLLWGGPVADERYALIASRR